MEPRLLTRDEFREIEDEALFLISIDSRKANEGRLRRFENRVSFLSRDLPGGKGYIVGELASYVRQACGRVRDKQHWSEAVLSSIHKVKNFCVAKDSKGAS